MKRWRLSDGQTTVKVQLEEFAKLPRRAHDADAGLDVFSPLFVKVPARGSVAIDTGVHIAIPRGYVGMLKSKSGLYINHGITSEGTIDSGYTGSVIVCLQNHSDEDYYIHTYDKISQLVILPILLPKLEKVDRLDETERGSKGFGSTGR